MGVPFEQGHFFAMFVSVFAFLTPPVAMVALVASKIADAKYIPHRPMGIHQGPPWPGS